MMSARDRAGQRGADDQSMMISREEPVRVMGTIHADYDELASHESPDAVIVTTPDGEILHWNRGAETVFGFNRAEAIGRRVTDLLVPPDRLDEESRLTAATLTNSFATFESLRRRKDGTLVYVDISSKLIHDPARGAQAILFIAQTP